MKMHHLLLATAASLTLGSCAYTGDPNQGGLFGWSQSMANDRIAVREQRLAELDNENAYQRGRTAELERQAANKKAQLNH